MKEGLDLALLYLQENGDVWSTMQHALQRSAQCYQKREANEWQLEQGRIF